MANENQEEKVGFFSEMFFWKPRRFLKDKILNKAIGSQPLREQLIPGKGASSTNVFRELDRELGLRKRVRGLNDSLKIIEEDWEKLMGVREQITKLYAEVGPFTDYDISKFEVSLLKYGLGGEEGIKYEKEKINIGGVDFNFKLPKKVTIRYPDHIPGSDDIKYKENRQYELAYFGYEHRNKWEGYFSEDLKKFRTDLINKIIKDEKWEKYFNEDLINNPELVDKIIKENNLTEEGKKFKKIIKNSKIILDIFDEYNMELIEGCVQQLESDFRTKLKKAATKLDFIDSTIDYIRTKYPGKKHNIRYYHTYKVIATEKYNCKNNEVKRFENEYKKVCPKFFKLNDEVAPGLDENGWPLEVDDEEGSRTGTPYAVLIDKWKGREIREVAKDWIKKVDPLHEICWVSNEYDALRDDLRDGRWHGHTLTATDYLMAANPSPWGEWPNKEFVKGKVYPEKKFCDNDFSKKFNSYKMDFENGKSAIFHRDPSNLSPALDLRAPKKWEHIGRMYYYDITDGIDASLIKEPMITTRGAAIFIIEKVIRKMKTLKDAEKVLKGIATETKGFDYGPRKWLGEFCDNPFNLQNQLNELEKEGIEEHKMEDFDRWE
jgi:hypothetical protein